MKEILLELYDFIASYIIFTDWERIFNSAKTISVIVSVLCFILILILLFRIRKDIKKSLETVIESVAEAEETQKIKADEEEWQAVLDKIKSKNESDWKIAVVEADKILDGLIQKMGYSGQDMGERLKKILPAMLSNIEDVWWAHKIRNRIAHESDFHLEHSQAQRAVDIYEEAMKNLGAL